MYILTRKIVLQLLVRSLGITKVEDVPLSPLINRNFKINKQFSSSVASVFAMKDLASVSTKEQEEFLKSFDYILTDIDGVLLVPGFSTTVDGSDRGLNSLRKIGKKVLFVSNNCTRFTDALYESLKTGGFEVDKNELICPTHAIIDYLKKINLTKKVYVIGMTPLKTELKAAGFTLAEEAPSEVGETFSSLIRTIQGDRNVGAVVLETDININYVKMQRAVSSLLRPEVEFVVGAPDRKLILGPNLRLLGPGYFINAIEDLTDRKGLSLAKPSAHFSKFIMEKYKIPDPSRVLFIGDTIKEDMAFAVNAGYKKLLVLSGATKKEHLQDWHYADEYKPDYYLESLKELYNILEKNFGNKL